VAQNEPTAAEPLGPPPWSITAGEVFHQLVLLTAVAVVFLVLWLFVLPRLGLRT
jgi:hypothetical protein